MLRSLIEEHHSMSIAPTLDNQMLVSCPCSVLVVLIGLAGTTYVAVSTTIIQFLHLLVTGILCGKDEKVIINKKLR